MNFSGYFKGDYTFERSERLMTPDFIREYAVNNEQKRALRRNDRAVCISHNFTLEDGREVHVSAVEPFQYDDKGQMIFKVFYSSTELNKNSYVSNTISNFKEFHHEEFRLNQGYAVGLPERFLKVQDPAQQLSGNDAEALLVQSLSYVNDLAVRNAELLYKKLYADRMQIDTDKNGEQYFGYSLENQELARVPLKELFSYSGSLEIFPEIVLAMKAYHGSDQPVSVLEDSGLTLFEKDCRDFLGIPETDLTLAFKWLEQKYDAVDFNREAYDEFRKTYILAENQTIKEKYEKNHETYSISENYATIKNTNSNYTSLERDRGDKDDAERGLQTGGQSARRQDSETAEQASAADRGPLGTAAASDAGTVLQTAGNRFHAAETEGAERSGVQDSDNGNSVPDERSGRERDGNPDVAGREHESSGLRTAERTGLGEPGATVEGLPGAVNGGRGAGSGSSEQSAAKDLFTPEQELHRPEGMAGASGDGSRSETDTRVRSEISAGSDPAETGRGVRKVRQGAEQGAGTFSPGTQTSLFDNLGEETGQRKVDEGSDRLDGRDVRGDGGVVLGTSGGEGTGFTDEAGEGESPAVASDLAVHGSALDERISNRAGRNFSLDRLAAYGSDRDRVRGNIDAVKALKQGDGLSEPERQKILSGYSGWGGLSPVFDGGDRWKSEYEELKSLLSEEEFNAVASSSLTAYYTPLPVIDGIYEAFKRFGFEQGEEPLRLLEPSCGTGHFMGRCPDKNAFFTGVELDPLSADIARALYPEHEILNQGFETLKKDELRNHDFDAVIGNVPFDSYSLYDAEYKDTPLENASIHNYFLAKSIDNLRSGGIAAFVVSSSFLDSDNARTEELRNYIADRADLVGAIRLPNKTFGDSNAGVTSDIVFFKRHDGTNNLSRDWTATGKVNISQEYGRVQGVQNKYFIYHPDQIIGKMEMVDGRYGPAPACVDERYGQDGYSLKTEISRRLASMPEKFYVPHDHLKITHDDCDREFMGSVYYMNLKPMQFFEGPDGKLCQKNTSDDFYHAYKLPDGNAGMRVRGMIKIRDDLRTLINAEKSEESSDEDLDALRADLNRDYDAFVKKYGYLNSADNLKLFDNDPESPLILSLESNYQKALRKNIKKNFPGRPESCEKADIFFRRVIVPAVETEHVDTASDGLIASVNHLGRVNIPYIAGILGAEEQKVIDELSGSDQIFLDPETDSWELRSKYLSGNVRKKLALAAEKAADDPRYAHNVKALQEVMPVDLDASDISVSLNSMWIPDKYINDFVQYLSEPGAWDENAQFVRSMPLVGSREFLLDRYDRSRFNWRLRKIDGTSLNGVTLDEIFSNVLQNTQTVVRRSVTDLDPNGKRTSRSVIDTEATIAAQQKAEEFQELFSDWVWQDPERRQELTGIYNEKFNSFVPPHYDGSHLSLTGAAKSVQLRPHQLNAVMRNIQEGYGLIDHVVGAGKTMVAIATVMEQKRLGLVSKPMVIVPNHLLYQWRNDFYRLYPDAKVLILTNEDFKTAASRELFASKVAVGSWDAVIMTHETFNRKIKMPPDYELNFFNSSMDDFTRALNQVKDKSSQSKLQRHIKFFEKKLKRIRDTEAKSFNSLDFTDLGVDCLVVDEAHAYKNLPYLTALQYKGMGSAEGSIKAYDLSMKVQYLQEKHNGKGVFFLTGTPISNTLCELYNMQKYLQPKLLKDLDIYSLDGWISVFGDAKSEYVLNSTATNYTLETRLSGIKNAPELMNMYNMMADVVTQGDLNEQARAQGKRPYVPGVKGGRPKNVVAEPSPDQQEYMKEIVHRMEHLPRDSSQDNPLKITNDARKCGLDYRLIDPEAEDFEGSKVNTCVDNVFKIWQRTAEERGTQLVFCDLSVPKKNKVKSKAKGVDEPETEVDLDQFSDNEELLAGKSDEDEAEVDQDALLAAQSDFSVYNDFRQKLIDRGVPAEEIAFIHDAKTNALKFKLFDDVNAGRVRILLGSTGKMGAGMNVQRRLVAAHHLDAPWRPSDIEQRNGRIIRQGNLFYENDPDFEVEIYNYATSRTYDARMWQTIESKSRTIEDFRKGNLAIRNFDDVSGGAATAAEMKAIASGNPLILSEIRLAQVEKKYMALEKSFKQKKFRMEDELMRLRKDPPSVKLQNFYARRKVILDQLPKDTKLNDKGQPAVELYVRGEVMPADSKEHVAKLREHFASVLGNCLDDRQDFADSGNAYLLGSYRGFRLIAQRRCLIADGFRILMEHEKTGVKFAPDNLFYYKKEFESINLQGFYQRVNNFIDKKMYEQFDFIESNFKSDQEKLEQLEIDVKASFRYVADLRIARLNHQNVIAQLELMKSDPGYVPDWHPYKMPNSADSLDDAVSLPPEVFDEVFEARVDFEAGKKQEEAVHYFTEGQQTLIDLPPATEPQNKQEPQDKQEEEQTDLQREELLNSHSHLKPCGQEDFDGAAENLRRELRNAFPGEKFSVTADNRNRYEKGLKIRFANPLIAAEIADHAFKFRDGDKTDFQKVFGQVPYLDLDFDPAKFEKEVTLADKTGKALSYDSPEDYVIVDYNCTPKLFFFDSDEAKSVGIRPLLDWKGKNEASLLNNHIIPQYWKFPRHLITDGTLDRFVDEKKMVASPRVFVTCADIARERKISIADVRAQMQENENTRKAAAMRVA